MAPTTTSVDVTMLADVAPDAGSQHTKHQKYLRMTTLSASGLMPSTEVTDHWLHAYASGTEDAGAASYKFGGLATKFAAFFPDGYRPASSSAKGAPLGVLEFISTEFRMGQTVGEVVAWALAMTGTREYMHGEHVANVKKTSNALSQAFTPTANDAYTEGFRTMYLVAYRDGGADYLGTGLEVTINSALGSVNETQTFLVCGGGHRLSVIKYTAALRDTASYNIVMTKNEASGNSDIDIEEIPVDATLRLGVVFGKE